MGYDRNDRDGWRGQSADGSYGRGRDDNRYGSQGGQGGYGGRDYGRPGYGQDQRGFFDRAGDEVRSWFGDEDAERRRRMDERYDDRQSERGDYGRGGSYDRYGYDRSNEGREDYGRQGYGDRGSGRMSAGRDDDRGYGSRSYGRADFAGGYGADRFRDHDDERRYGQGSPSNYGQRDLSRDRNDRHERHDPAYSNWRDRQMESFDRDYQDYRRENQTRFDSEFGHWRSRREGQRQHLGNVREHQEVVGSDDQHLGTVDHVQGDQIKLTKNDQNAGGQHHYIPCSWIDRVDDKVRISKTAAEARQHWTDEARNSGSGTMFGRDDDRQRQSSTNTAGAGAQSTATATTGAQGGPTGTGRS